MDDLYEKYQERKARGRAKTREWFSALPPAERAEYRRKAVRKNKQEHPERYLFGRAKRRARRRGIEFCLTIQDVVIPECCPVLGIVLERGGQLDNSPSLDRIDNAKGYVPGNVVVVSHRANRLKSDATSEELELLASYYRKKTPIFR